MFLHYHNAQNNHMLYLRHSYFYTKKKGINVFSAFDIIAPGFLIAQAFGRWGNFFNQEAHGGVIGGTLNGDALLTLNEQRAFLSNTLKLPDFVVNLDPKTSSLSCPSKFVKTSKLNTS